MSILFFLTVLACTKDEYNPLLSEMTLDEQVEFCEVYEPIDMYCVTAVEIEGEEYLYNYHIMFECQTVWVVNDCDATLEDMKLCLDIIWDDPCVSIFPIECAMMMECTFEYGVE